LCPLPPFSTYTQGKDTSRDQKWGLLYEFLRLVKSARPDIVTMENVPTVTRHAVFSEFAETLKNLGYHVWHDVIECSKYEVPQTRRRLVLLASRLGSISMVPPKRERPKTVRQALGRLAPIQAGERHVGDRLHTSSSLSPLNKRRIKASKPGGTWRDWPRSLVADCHRDSSGKTYPSVYGRRDQRLPLFRLVGPSKRCFK
jgi:DNA (cytosine-5)-methyltransferase 1